MCIYYIIYNVCILYNIIYTYVCVYILYIHTYTYIYIQYNIYCVYVIIYNIYYFIHNEMPLSHKNRVKCCHLQQCAWTWRGLC